MTRPRTKPELEARAHDLARSALDRRNLDEDDELELKGEFPPEPAQMAKWLAGHANAARGAPVLWIFGIDGRTREIVPPRAPELANYWTGVASHFDEHHMPEILHTIRLSLDHEVRPVAAWFDTSQPPYVSKRDGVRETPWRKGNRNDPATRQQLLRMLVPIAEAPEIELFSARLVRHEMSFSQARPVDCLGLELVFFGAQPQLRDFVIAAHSCEVSLDRGGGMQAMERIRTEPHESREHVSSTFSEARVRGAGRFVLHAFDLSRPDERPVGPVLARAVLAPLFSERRYTFEVELAPDPGVSTDPGVVYATWSRPRGSEGR